MNFWFEIGGKCEHTQPCCKQKETFSNFFATIIQTTIIFYRHIRACTSGHEKVRLANISPSHEEIRIELSGQCRHFDFQDVFLSIGHFSSRVTRFNFGCQEVNERRNCFRSFRLVLWFWCSDLSWFLFGHY